MKKLKLKLLIPVSCLLTGCGIVEIPEGDIKNFVDQLDYKLAYEHVNTGKSIITASYYVNDVLDGQVCSTTYFDKTSDTKYYYINTEVEGSFIGNDSDQYPYNNQQILAYLDSEKNVKVFKKTDEILENISYREEDINTSINNFFYLELEGGYHRGGVYYGDYIKVNCGQFYDFFHLNSAKDELRYAILTKSLNSENEEIETLHDFVVDKYGMIITLESTSTYKARTTITCDYNIEIEKKYEL